MFTGIIEEIGKIKDIKRGTSSASITIEAQKVLEDIILGDSICTNGVCLTVTDFTKNTFTVDVMPETMRKSNLNNLKNGNYVNLERALTLSTRLGGHIVSGHIDGVGTVHNIKKEDNAFWISVKTSKDILKYIIYKGSITMDGVSLTVACVDDFMFKVSIIPHTSEKTTLLDRKVGDVVNLESDIVGKYIERFIKLEEKKEKDSIDMNFLSKNGFI